MAPLISRSFSSGYDDPRLIIGKLLVRWGRPL
ncbi:hypothetical protein ABIE06_002099, partial [Pantoea dispersa]